MAPEEALFPEGGGEVRALIRSMDWSRSGLGQPADWSLPLRTTVSTCLASRYPMFLWWGPDLINIYNDAYAPLMGTKHPHGMGRPAWEVWAEIWDIVGPLATRVIEQAEATWSEAQRLDLERSGYAEETYFDFAYSPVLSEDGSVAGILGVVSEITQRILGERRLRALSQIASRTHGIDGVQEVAREAVAALEADRADLPFVLLYEPAERMAGRMIASLGPEVAQEKALAALERELLGPGKVLESVLTGGNPVLIDPLPAGPLVSAGSPHPDADKALVLPIEEAGEPAHTLVLVCGLSAHRALDADLRQFCGLVASAIGSAIGDARAFEEERARTEALAELDRAKTEFFSNVSHEFRTPLTLLLGPLEEAARQENPDPELVMAHRNALRLLRHVNTLLEYSRLQAQRTKTSPRPVDLAGMCTALTGVFRSATERAGLELELECPDGPVPALADPNHLEQIILNLLSNALKFTLQGRIMVRVLARDDYAGIEVSDTGSGISRENLARLFERFHRIEGAEARSHEGSGLGLALTKELVELQGGELDVSSEVGRGTTFTVLLPGAPIGQDLVRPTASEQAEAFVNEALRWSEVVEPELGLLSEPDESQPSAESASVLVVDDNADMREYLSRLLRRRFDVRLATDGAQALEILRREPVDLVLSDVMMPRLDGFGLLRAIRADESLSPTPVVLLSARAGEEAAIEGLDAGADDYVVKPFTARELLARVSANLELGAMRNREARRAADYAERLEELLHREHTIAVTLQRSMLPHDLDAGAFTRIAARYEPAMEAMQVGGDFYDVLTLPDGGLLLFIGDVAGHGLESAIVMGAMRAALRAYVLSHAAPDRVLADMNTFALTHQRTPMVTGQCVVVDADGLGATYATAGHPPGLIRHPDGRITRMDAGSGPPLGVRPLARFAAVRVAIEPRSSIVLYTDGLIERRDEILDAGIERLERSLSAQSGEDAEGVAEALLVSQRDWRGQDDDVALLIAALDAPRSQLKLELPAGPQTLPRLRHTLQRWLAAQSVDPHDAYDILFAANEAAANVVKHAYGLRRGSMDVEMRAQNGTIDVVVSDRGQWRPRRSDTGGRGLELMHEVMDDVRVEQGSNGSVVSMSKRIRRRQT